MLQRGKILLIADGAASMSYALPLIDALSLAGIKVTVAPTAYPGGALSFTTEEALAAVSGSGCLDIAGLTAEKLNEFDCVVMAPVSVGVLRVFSAGAARNLLAGFSKTLIVVPVMMASEENACGEDLEQWLKDCPCEARMLLPKGDRLSLGRLGSLAVASCQRCALAVESRMENQDFAGKNVLITAGPTIEDIDPARYVSNRSTGKMGIALAKAVALRGANVILVCGPVNTPVPKMDNLQVEPVRSASQMNAKVVELAHWADVAVLCAAVADFTPNVYVEHKIKKGKEDNLTLLLKRTPDILAGLGALEDKPFLVGFAAESDELELNAIHKLQRKHCDMLCANDITEPGCGFGTDTNRITVYHRDGTVDRLDLMTKDQAASAIFNIIKSKLN